MQDIETTMRGNAGSDVELTHGQGWSRATFRLACTPRRLRQGQWSDGETTWITVVCWGRLAEHVRVSVAKGDPVLVTGRLRTSAWTKDGQRHERLVVEASAVGHDLTRGTAQFTRRSSWVVTTDDGSQVDTRTGMVVHEPDQTPVDDQGHELDAEGLAVTVDEDDLDGDDFGEDPCGREVLAHA